MKINSLFFSVKVISYYVVVDEIDEGDVTIDEEGNEVDVPPAINLDAQILLEDAREIVPDIEVGDKDLMVELTGIDMKDLMLAANIVACDFADATALSYSHL